MVNITIYKFLMIHYTGVISTLLVFCRANFTLFPFINSIKVTTSRYELAVVLPLPSNSRL